MCNPICLANVPVVANVLSNLMSDHSPVIVKLINQGGVRNFKFFNIWTEHESFFNLVRKAREDLNCMFLFIK